METSGSLPTQPQMVLEVLSHPPVLRFCSFRMKRGARSRETRHSLGILV